MIPPPYPEARAFIAVFISWFVSQAAKVCQGGITDKKVSLRWLFKPGGMPSSHSATVSCLATCIGLYYGFTSLTFLAVLIFSIIIMFDAAGVRRNMGRQAKVLNKMLDELYEEGQFHEERLRELLGHTPVEVFAGAFLGIVIGYVACRI